MEIILLETVERLGQLGDVVRVRPGYARNYLIPQGKARYATEENLAEVRARREELERKAQEALAAAARRRDALAGFAVAVQVETNPDGKLFGSVGPSEIARAMSEAGAELERQEIRLPDGPLRELGEHEVIVHLHPEIETAVRVTVESGSVVALPDDEDEEPAEAAAAAAEDAAETAPDAAPETAPTEETEAAAEAAPDAPAAAPPAEPAADGTPAKPD